MGLRRRHKTWAQDMGQMGRGFGPQRPSRKILRLATKVAAQGKSSLTDGYG
jgi:hypothetical protein